MAEWKEVKLPNGPDGIPGFLKNYEVIEQKIGNQTNTEDNNNKFFSIERLKVGSDWYCYTNYGRVSNEEFTGACGLYGPGTETEMKDFFESKFKSKVRPSKGYIEIKFAKAKVGSPKARVIKYGIDINEVPEEKKKKLEESEKKTDAPVKKLDLHSDIQRLVKQWYADSSNAITSNSAVTITSDGLATPLGILTFAQLEKGKTILGELGEAVKNNKNKDIKKLTGDFYSNIPTKLGHKISDDDLISTDVIIQQKLDLVQMMVDALEVGGKTYSSEIDVKYLELGIEAEFLEKTNPEWIRLERKVRETKGHNHYGTTTKVKNIIKLHVKADRSRYMFCNIPKETELWHGSRNVNIIGILKSGMKIAPPEAPRSGLAFGRGAYFADKSTKSLSYSLAHFPGVEHSKNCFLFVFNVKVGKQMEAHYGNGNEADVCRKKGFDSVFAKAGNGLIHNEYIIPDVAQCSIQYIIELER